MNPWRWRKAIRKRPRKCNGKSISEGAEQQSRCDELQSADYLFRWEETRTSPSWALFVLCKLSTCLIRAPRVGKSIFIQLEWFIFRWTVSFIVLCVFHNTVSSSFQSFFSFLLEPRSIMRTMMLSLSLFSSSSRRRSGQSVTASDFGSNGPRFESGRGRCVESLDKALYSHCPKEKPSH